MNPETNIRSNSIDVPGIRAGDIAKEKKKIPKILTKMSRGELKDYTVDQLVDIFQIREEEGLINYLEKYATWEQIPGKPIKYKLLEIIPQKEDPKLEKTEGPLNNLNFTEKTYYSYLTKNNPVGVPINFDDIQLPRQFGLTSKKRLIEQLVRKQLIDSIEGKYIIKQV